MIRALFVYRYCTLGGVETGLRFRIERLPELGIDAHALFLRDYGGWQSFTGLEDRAFLNPNEKYFTDLIRRERYDVVSVIDSFDVLDWIAGSGWNGKVMVELRSTYEHTLAELKRLADHRVDGILVPSRFQHDNVAAHLPRRVRREVPRFVAHNFVDFLVNRLEPLTQHQFATLQQYPQLVGRDHVEQEALAVANIRLLSQVIAVACLDPQEELLLRFEF